MYNSPLLEGEAQSRFPKSRAYDPSKVGDHPEPVKMYASNGDSPAAAKGTRPDKLQPADPEQSGTSSSKDEATPPPALSTTSKSSEVANGRGAKQKPTDESNQRSAGSGETQVDGRQKPALSAQFAWAMYRLNGVEFSDAAKTQVPKLFRECKARGDISHSSKPAVGDLVFFHNTGDFNDDGRNNDWYTHVAIVESVDGASVTLLGYRGDEVKRFQMNLESPNAAKDRHGEVANSQLRRRQDQDAPFTQYLAGQLFAGTCSALGDRAELVVVDNWKPGMTLEK